MFRLWRNIYHNYIPQPPRLKNRRGRYGRESLGALALDFVLTYFEGNCFVLAMSVISIPCEHEAIMIAK